MTIEKRRRGRPPKFPPEEVRSKLIESGISTLREEGVESGLDAVGLDAAIADAEVPRGMSYRIWQDSDRTPQDALRHHVCLTLLSIPATTGIQDTRALLNEVLAEFREELDSGDEDVRRRVITELIRTVGAFNHEALYSSDDWRLYNALRSASITRSDNDPAVIELLDEGESRLITEYAALYQELADALGLTLRDGLTMAQFTVASNALNEGLSCRRTSGYERTGISWTADAGEDPKEWTLFSIGLEALVRHFFHI